MSVLCSRASTEDDSKFVGPGSPAGVFGRGPSGGGGEGGFTGRAALGYDHGYDAEVFCLGLAFDPAYVEGSWRAFGATLTDLFTVLEGNRKGTPGW